MTSATEAQPTQTEALLERLFGAAIETLELASVHLGDRLGFYRALADGGDATPAELAARTGTTERYVREWLEQQAVAGFLSVDDGNAEPSERRYALPAAHRPVFVDEEDLSYLAPLARLAVGVLGPMDALLEAYRGGGGVPYEAYGVDVRDGVGAINRPMFVNQLAGWLASIPDVDERLRAQPPARVADVACGSGWSSIAIARAYPEVTVDAIDADTESIETARRNVADAGLADRVRPAVHDASDAELRGRYDLVTIFEALHDMADPVAVLTAARGVLAEGGSVFIGDERVADTFTAPAGEIERLQYAFSVLHCLPATRAEGDHTAHGTILRAPTLLEWAGKAGFTEPAVLDIANDFWRFYRLRG
jgi:SAM-dependent methyltransferase